MLAIIAKLVPIVLVTVEWLKKRLGLDGWRVIGVSWVVSLGTTAAYGIAQGWLWWQIVGLGLFVGVAANGGYDLVKDWLTKTQ